MTWNLQDKKFLVFYSTVLFLALSSGFSIGMMAVGSMQEFGLSNLFSSVMMVTVAATILIGSNNIAFTKKTIVAYIAAVNLPVIVYMGSILNIELVGYWGLLFLYAILTVQQIFSSRELVLKNIEMTNFYQSQFEYYKSILESVPGLVTIFKEDLQYEIINSKVCEFTGLGEQELLGSHLGFSKITPCFENTVIEFKNSYLTQNQVKVKLSGIREEKWFLMALHKIKSTGQIAVVSIDIDAQVLAEEKSLNQRAMVESSAQMAAIGQLAAGIAHEINNPLAVITAKADQILRRLQGSSDEKNSSDLSKIQATAFRIAKIVKGLKALSRDGEKDPFIESNVEDVLNDLTLLFEEKIRTHNIHLIKNIDPHLKFECRATQLSQVVMNLISNSIDAIQNLDERWIKIETQLVNQSILLSVTDSGKGISEEIVSKLMTPFFTTKAAGVGTGLGLSISKRIVQDHQGTLYYDQTSANTRFIAKIPQKQSQKKSA